MAWTNVAVVHKPINGAESVSRVDKSSHMPADITLSHEEDTDI